MQNPYENDRLGAEEKQQLLEELQLAKSGTLHGQREVLNQSMPVCARPADSNRRAELQVHGTSRELRRRSVVAEFEQPLLVGSFYELTLSDPDTDDIQAFARCDQVTMVAETHFEGRFQLLEPLTSQQPLSTQHGGDDR